MTLAVAAIFPWPDWIEAAPDPIRRSHPPSSLIFVADSRWSYPSRGRRHDGALKVAAIDKVGAATYAGNTEAGETAIGYITQYCQQARPDVRPDKLVEAVRSAWNQHKRGDDDSLQFALGFIDRSLQPLLWRLDSWNGFEPLAVPGITYLGMPTAIEYFRSHLDRKVAEAWSTMRDGNAVDATPGSWASIMQSIVWLAGEEKVHDYVGGPPTCLIVDDRGVSGLTLATLDAEGDVSSAREVSLDPADVQRFYDHPWRKRRKLGWRWKQVADD